MAHFRATPMVPEGFACTACIVAGAMALTGVILFVKGCWP